MIARVAEILITLGISIYFLLSQKTLLPLRHTSVLHSANRLQHLIEVPQYFFCHEAIFRLFFQFATGKIRKKAIKTLK